MAIASLVLGIISIVFVFSGGLAWIGVIIGIVGIILGALGRRDIERKGLATAGLVCSIIAVAVDTTTTIACLACAGGMAALM